jgi:hypothetical protein
MMMMMMIIIIIIIIIIIPTTAATTTTETIMSHGRKHSCPLHKLKVLNALQLSSDILCLLNCCIIYKQHILMSSIIPPTDL